MESNPREPHDLEGLEVLMHLVVPLEEIFVALYEYEQHHRDKLHPSERENIKKSYFALAMALDALHNRS